MLFLTILFLFVLCVCLPSPLSDAKFLLFKPDRRLLREGMIKRLKEMYVLSDAASQRPANDPEMADQLLFLFNDLLLWTTPQFDITGFVDLVKLVSLPTQLATPFTICLAIKGKPFGADMVFACKDKEEHDQWRRFLVSRHALASVRCAALLLVARTMISRCLVFLCLC